MTYRTRVALACTGLLAAGLLAALLRYQLVEPPALAQRCAVDPAVAWCSLRALTVAGFLSNAFGNLALAAAALAMVWRRAATAWPAATLGVVALQLYCYETGALALLIGSLLLVRRLPPPAAHGQPHRGGEQDVQPQP